MTKSPKVLFVSINFFCPEFLDGGNKIIYNLLKKNDEFEPSFLSLFTGNFSTHDQKLFSHLKIDSILNKKSSFFLKILKIFSWLFLFQSRVCLPSLYARRIAKEIKKIHIQYDAIHLTSLSLAVVLNYLPSEIRRKIVLSAVDSYSMFMERRLKTESSTLKRLVSKIEFIRGAKFEKKYYQMPGAVLFVSEVDSNYAQSAFGHHKNIFHIPLGVNTEYFKKDQSFSTAPYKIIFTGNLSYGPNKNACLFLAKEVLPLLKNRIPNLQLILAGSNPPKELSQYKNENLIITGFVDDLRPYIDRSHLFVSPLMFGAGMKYKVLEAFSMQKICLCSSISVDGIHCIDGEHCIVVKNNDASTWSETIMQALDNIENLEKMGKSAQQLIVDNYSWTAIRSQYRSIYERLKSEL